MSMLYHKHTIDNGEGRRQIIINSLDTGDFYSRNFSRLSMTTNMSNEECDSEVSASETRSCSNISSALRGQ